MQDESGGRAGLAEVSEALLAQWLKQTEQQMQHSLQELVQALQQQLQQQLSVQQATVASAELAGIAQSQLVQQQHEQQLQQLRQLLLNAEEEKKEVLTAMAQLAAQLRLSQDEFQAEKQQHALTLQQLTAVQQQLSAVQQQVPPAGHLAELEQEVARLRQLHQEWQPLQHKLESQLFRAQARAEALEERQLSEAEQGRDTIRELRQQLSQQREHYEQQLQSVQLQATEFRLKFEYAQQQLLQLPG